MDEKKLYEYVDTYLGITNTAISNFAHFVTQKEQKERAELEALNQANIEAFLNSEPAEHEEEQ
jgi:hypothetical protein